MRNRVANYFRPTESRPFFCRVATYLWQPSGTLDSSQNCQKFIASLPEIAASRPHPKDAATYQRAAITPLSRIAKPKLPRQLPIVSSRKIATTAGLSAKNSRWTLAVTWTWHLPLAGYASFAASWRMDGILKTATTTQECYYRRRFSIMWLRQLRQPY